MKPFNLEEAKAGKPVVTRDGRGVRILAFDRKGDHCIVTLIDSCRHEDVLVYRENGKASADFDSEYDLFMKAEKKEGWINLYRDAFGIISAGVVYRDETTAKSQIGTGIETVTTIKVEWEE